MKTSSVIGLDLGLSVAKMVEYSRDKKQVTTMAKLFLDREDWANEKSLSKKIKQWLHEKKQARSAELIAAVPAEYAVMHKAWIPADEKNFREYMRWDLEQYLGDSRDDYLMSFQTVEANADLGYTEYQVGAYRKTEVLRLKKLLHFSEMPLTVLDVDAFAILNAYEANYPEHHPYHTLLIKADFNGIAMLHVHKSRFLDFHVLPMPENFLAQSEDEKVSCFRSQATRLTKYFQQSFLGSISGDPLVVLAGDLSTDAAFITILREGLGQEVQLLDAFKEVHFPHDPEHAAKVKENAPQCATALGLALRAKGDGQ